MILKAGTRFTVKDKLGREYLYEFIGLDLNDPTGCGYIHLFNLTMNRDTAVERQWFEERIIKHVNSNVDTCPICGFDLEHGDCFTGEAIDADESRGYRFHCKNCGVSGTEWYSLEFSSYEIDE